MKRLLSVLISAVVVAGSVLIAQPAAAADELTIPDPQLRACISAHAGGTPTAENVTKITTLSCALFNGDRMRDPFPDFYSLTGLEALTNLTSLYLSRASVPSLEPLAGLTQLTSITLGRPYTGRAQLGDLSPLVGLTNLETLALYGTSLYPRYDETAARFSDLSPLRGLTKLKVLALPYAQVKDVTPLAGLTQLTELQLNNNRIEDVSPLANLPQLSWLYLWENRVTDLSPLGDSSAPLTRLWTERQNPELPPVAINTAQANPIHNLSGATIVPTSATATYDSVAHQWSYGQTGDNQLTWRNELDRDQFVGNYFSGTLFQRSETHQSRFTSPQVEACVRENLGLSAEVRIYPTMLARITSLNCGSRRITDITDMAQLPNVVTLNLGDNSISDLTPLSTLTSLTTLKLGRNQISDLSALAPLVKLDRLELNNNFVQDLAPLQGMRRLDRLYLWENEISDLSPLGSHHILQLWVERQYVALPDLAAGESQPNPLVNRDGSPVVPENVVYDEAFNSWGYSTTGPSQVAWRAPLAGGLGYPDFFSGTVSQIATADEVTSFAPEFTACLNELLGQEPDAPIYVTQIKRISTLDCSDRGISSLSGITEMPQLASLNLSNNDITDVTLLGHLSALTTLNLSGNALGDVAALNSLSALTELRLNDNRLSDISALSGLAQLTTLSLDDNQIVDLTRVPKLAGLKTLSLVGNGIHNIKPLGGLTGLTTVNLSANNISDISTFYDLDSVATLDLSSNDITDITPLKDLKPLAALNLAGNTVADLGPLTRLTRMTSLNLEGNAVTDLRPLNGLAKLASLNVAEQAVTLADIAVNTPQANILADNEGFRIRPTSTTATYDAAPNVWTFAEAGRHTLTWTSEVIIGQVTTSFTGTITQVATRAE
ncbi:leucine-rich repeat domain-containing protein [Klugiella xanthotipulae]|uniref:leucine-rich repeat domain-containing protein n=1 Tax=Klugiella xanthotipulae TaxID=244735 RepID=UPI001476BAD8|nr:leucine-rich repeat domain-containing protein [Klugiella xanthotipulae]